MPEGPEIRRQADRLHAVLAGKRVEHVAFAFDGLQAEAAGLVGRRVERVTSRGKAMLTCFDDARVVYSHNQLYGRWMIRKVHGPEPRTRRQLRFEIRTRTHRALLYSASTIELLREGELDHHPFLARLGPDPLDDDVDEARMRTWMRRPAFARRRLGSLLLDQGFVAGIGNYLRSEVLFVARLGPSSTPGSLTATQLRRLAGATLEITRRSYRTGGITNLPARAQKLKAQGLPRWRYRHFVFGLAGHPCPKCRTPIEKSEVAGRRLYACPTCQP